MNLQEVAVVEDVAAAVGHTETHPKTTILMETGNCLLVKVQLMSLMLESLMKGVKGMVGLVGLSEVAAEVVSAMEKQEKVTVIALVGHWIAAAELVMGMLFYSLLVPIWQFVFLKGKFFVWTPAVF